MPLAGVDRNAWLDRGSAALQRGAVRAANRRASTDVAEEVRLICEETYGTDLWGDKYNEYLLELPWLARVFPAARWIFIVREPADVVASMLAWRRGKVWNPGEAPAAATKWATWNSRWLSFRDSLASEQAFEVGYEQLAAEGGHRLSEWLGFDVASHLSAFEARKYADPVEITAEARDVRRSFAELGLLAVQVGDR